MRRRTVARGCLPGRNHLQSPAAIAPQRRIASEELAHVPRPQAQPGLQSTQVNWPFVFSGTLTPGIQEASVTVTQTSGDYESDNQFGLSAFSLQNNTNSFAITCHPNWISTWLQEGVTGSTATGNGGNTNGPLPGANNAALPGCTTGDNGWVQFV
jgi:hypothetical protein